MVLEVLMELFNIDNSGGPSAGDGEDFIPRRQHKIAHHYVRASNTVFCDLMLYWPPYPALSIRHIKCVTAEGQCTTVSYFLVS